MKILASVSLVAALSLASLPALADALPPDPCFGKVQGDACTDLSNKSGTCKDGTMCMPSPCLVCDTSGSSSSSSSGGTTSSSSSGGNTSSSSSGGSTSSSSSGSASSSSGGGTETDEGSCAFGPGAGASGALVAAVLGLLGAAAAARRKRR